MFPLLRLPPLKFSPHFPFSTTPTSPSLITDPTLTLYFLQKSCHLSPSAASSAAKEINLKSTKNPHSVLSLLRLHNFSDPQISRLISLHPKLLLSSPSRTIQPKLDFYSSLGLSIPDFSDRFCAKARVFRSSVKNRLAPNLRLLRLLIPSDEDLLAAVRRYPAIILADLQKIVPEKTKLLLDSGVPLAAILKLLALHPRCLTKCLSEFQTCFAEVKGLGVSASSAMFCHAFAVVSKVPRAVWDRRVENFARLGWSGDEIRDAFRRHPYCMSSSEEKVRRNAEFFGGVLGWGPAKLCGSPVLLSLSLERRIGPRYRVFEILDGRGFLKEGISCRHFLLGEKRFRKKYVENYQEIVPEILEAVSGK